MIKKYLSTSDVANLLGVTRWTVFRRIQSGEIKATKVGGRYVVNRDDLVLPGEKGITDNQADFINSSVKMVVSEYGETLKKLKDV